MQINGVAHILDGVVLFEDPDGIRIEVNYVPGKGVLDPSTPRTSA